MSMANKKRICPFRQILLVKENIDLSSFSWSAFPIIRSSTSKMKNN